MATGILPGLTSLHLEGYPSRKSTFAMETAECFVSTQTRRSQHIFEWLRSTTG